VVTNLSGESCEDPTADILSCRSLICNDPLFYRKTRLLDSAEKIDVRNLGESRPTCFGFDVSFFEDALFAVDRDNCPIRAPDSFNDNLPVFQSDQKNSELVFLEFLLRINSISVFLLNPRQLLLLAILQNPINDYRA